MNNKKLNGFRALKLKSVSIITAAVASLLNTSNTHASAITTDITDSNSDIGIDNLYFKTLKPKLVLKLNLSDSDKHILSQHRSHSSHSSHRSHSSHSSHSSHYSSSYSGSSGSTTSGSYNSPSYSSPSSSSSYSSGTNTKTNKNSSSTSNFTSSPNSSTSTQTINSSPYIYSLGDRELYKGCEGADVKALQELLSKLDYDVIVSEYFGDKTEQAVIQFQKANELKPDGKVGTKTLALIKSKAW